MIITTNLIPAPYWAITIWPFIFVSPDRISDKGILVHESVHYNEQHLITPIWWLRYLLSTKFRVAAEVRAYTAQVASGEISTTDAATWLMTYDKSLTLEQAHRLICGSPL